MKLIKIWKNYIKLNWCFFNYFIAIPALRFAFISSIKLRFCWGSQKVIWISLFKWPSTLMLISLICWTILYINDELNIENSNWDMFETHLSFALFSAWNDISFSWYSAIAQSRSIGDKWNTFERALNSSGTSTLNIVAGICALTFAFIPSKQKIKWSDDG